jgi:hypothetical protein
MRDLFTHRGADFSPCRRYRYNLWRRWGDGLALNVICLNPSAADEALNDPTVERLERRARGWGYPALVVTNLFGLRSTDPAALKGHPDPIGSQNDLWIDREARAAELVLCAWGQHGRLLGRGAGVEARLRSLGIPLYALRFGKDGSPSHPLYLAYPLRPVRWEPL